MFERNSTTAVRNSNPVALSRVLKAHAGISAEMAIKLSRIFEVIS